MLYVVIIHDFYILYMRAYVYQSNAGDSRSVISTKDGKGIPMTQDHKPKHPNEHTRIKNAGGFVENGRVNGKNEKDA